MTTDADGKFFINGNEDRAAEILEAHGFDDFEDKDDFVVDEVNGIQLLCMKVTLKQADGEDVDIEDVDDGRVTCPTCSQGGLEEEMAICDECDKGFHLECVVPPLKVRYDCLQNLLLEPLVNINNMVDCS